VVLLVDDDDALDRAQPLAVVIVVAGAVSGCDGRCGQRERGGGPKRERAPVREPHADPSPVDVAV
jgi:hypothetical protein